MATITVNGAEYTVTRSGMVTTVKDSDGYVVGWVERRPVMVTPRYRRHNGARETVQHFARCADGYELGGADTRKRALDSLTRRWMNVRASVVGVEADVEPVDAVATPDTCGTCDGSGTECVCDGPEDSVDTFMVDAVADVEAVAVRLPYGAVDTRRALDAVRRMVRLMSLRGYRTDDGGLLDAEADGYVTEGLVDAYLSSAYSAMTEAEAEAVTRRSHDDAGVWWTEGVVGRECAGVRVVDVRDDADMGRVVVLDTVSGEGTVGRVEVGVEPDRGGCAVYGRHGVRYARDYPDTRRGWGRVFGDLLRVPVVYADDVEPTEDTAHVVGTPCAAFGTGCGAVYGARGVCVRCGAVHDAVTPADCVHDALHDADGTTSVITDPFTPHALTEVTRAGVTVRVYPWAVGAREWRACVVDGVPSAWWAVTTDDVVAIVNAILHVCADK